MERGDVVGYRIEYGQEPKIQTQKTGSARIRIMIALSFLVFAGLVRILWPEGRELLIKHLIPGDPSLAEAAFLNLLKSLQEGAGMMDSLTVFCQELLYEII